jgi:hypothetical protein
MQAQWTFSLYPEAAEGGGCLSRRAVAFPSGRPPDGERAAEEAARRARAKIRLRGFKTVFTLRLGIRG